VELNGVVAQNFNVNTGVENLPIPFRTATNMPKDGGFGARHADGSPGTIDTGFGNGDFNAPPLFEAADTPPFFHNGAISIIEDAVAFYQSPQFLASPPGAFIRPVLTPDSIQNIGGFLRTINALVNIAEVRKRVEYLRDNETEGGDVILRVSLRDTDDAIADLSAPRLSGAATADALAALGRARGILESARERAEERPSRKMTAALAELEAAKTALLTGNPNDAF
jgi:hypothetical protein